MTAQHLLFGRFDVELKVGDAPVYRLFYHLSPWISEGFSISSSIITSTVTTAEHHWYSKIISPIPAPLVHLIEHLSVGHIPRNERIRFARLFQSLSGHRRFHGRRFSRSSGSRRATAAQCSRRRHRRRHRRRRRRRHRRQLSRPILPANRWKARTRGCQKGRVPCATSPFPRTPEVSSKIERQEHVSDTGWTRGQQRDLINVTSATN